MRKQRAGFIALAAALAIVCYAAGSRLAFSSATAPRPSLIRALSASRSGRVPASMRPSQARLEPDPGWESMVKDLSALAADHPGQVGVIMRDLKTGREWAYHAEDLFPSASLIKIPILSALMERVRSGELSLETKLTLRRRLRLGGSGSIKWARDGSVFTVRELMEHMVTESDNTAMKMLISYVGFDFLSKQFEKMGLVYTGIHPDGLRLTSGRVSHENYTTAREMGELMERIYRGQVAGAGHSELMLDMMKNLKHRTRLSKNLPPGWEIAHKTGTLRRACHDAGIVYAPHGDYLVVVLTGKNRSYRAAKNFISKLAGRTFDYYRQGQVEIAKNY